MNSFFQITAIVLAGISALMSIMVITRAPQPASPVWWAFKVYACALSPFLAMAGVVSVILGIITGSLSIILLGSYSALIYMIYLYRVNASIAVSGFSNAFGPDWEKRITSRQKARFLSNPTVWRLPQLSGDFILTQNIPFFSIPGTNRQLLCDVWQPSKSVKPSGLAFIYFHGSAWVVLDKDFGTRPFFRHLVSQGHVIMDVAYRLFPETDMTGMVNDVYRAIAWMKTNAAAYEVNPNGIVIGGGSAGGHLSLLAGYAYRERKFIPAELADMDLTVLAVISAYGPPGLEALYYHTRQDVLTRGRSGKKKTQTSGVPRWVQKIMDKDFPRLGMDKPELVMGLAYMLGCRPDECPEIYKAFSPLTYVHRECPPTLFIQGKHDLITPVHAANDLYQRLTEAGVPAVMYLIPQTDHAFDLVLPKISWVAHTAFYVVERFLALQVYELDRMTHQKPLTDRKNESTGEKYLHLTKE